MTRKRKGSKRRAPSTLTLPSFITPHQLAKRLNTTIVKVHKRAAQTFKWWPDTPAAALRKASYKDIKQIILNFEEASELAQRFGSEAELEPAISIDPPPGHKPVRQPRQPLVSILGHVDHGKTTLMDKMRGTSVAMREHGGITQDTYCFQVDVDGSPVTMLDTPGHRVFRNMRDNAMFLSDLALLVVDLSQGVQPQTVESIEFALEHKVPLLPVVTKADDGLDTRVPGNDGDGSEETTVPAQVRVKEIWNEISRITEATSTPLAEPIVVSALTGFNMKALSDQISERLRTNEPTADVAAPGYGAVVDALMEGGGRGRVMTVVLWQGALNIGDHFVAGAASGRVKHMTLSTAGDTAKNAVKKALPGVPVQIMGLRNLPEPGQDFYVLSKDQSVATAEERRCEQLYPLQERFATEEFFSDDAEDWDADMGQADVLFAAQADEKDATVGTVDSKGVEIGNDGTAVGAELEEEQEEARVWEDFDANEPEQVSFDAEAMGLYSDVVVEEEEEYVHGGDGSEFAPYLVIVKADTQSMLQSLLNECEQPFEDAKTGEERHVSVIAQGIGPITHKDVLLSDATGASIQCFRVRMPSRQTNQLVERLGVKVNAFNVYFDFLKDRNVLVE